MAKKTKRSGGKSRVRVRDMKARKDAKGGGRVKVSTALARPR